MISLYRSESSNPKWNAQRNLQGRTHYVDDDSLRFHKSRILSARHHDDGLLFSIVTSDALDYQNTMRGFRYVIFDVFGTVLDRPRIEGSYSTSKAASKACYVALEAIAARTHTLAAIDRAKAAAIAELDQLAETVTRLGDAS